MNNESLKNEKSESARVSGFEKSLEGEQNWPPKMFNIKRLVVGIDWEEGEDKTVKITHEQPSKTS